MDYCAQNCLYRFDQALRGVLDNFPVRWAAWLMRPLVFPLGSWRRPATDRDGKEIVRAALEPGRFPRPSHPRDLRLPTIPTTASACSNTRCCKVVATEEADKKLERAIRKGEVKRFHDNDWIAEAEREGRAHRGGGARSLPSSATSSRASSPSTISMPSECPSRRGEPQGERRQAPRPRRRAVRAISPPSKSLMHRRHRTLPDLQDWRFTIDFEGIAWAVIDREGESMNSLGRRADRGARRDRQGGRGGAPATARSRAWS